MKNSIRRRLFLLLAVFLLCELAKDFEFLVLRTDQTWVAENILCKLFTIAVILFCLRSRHLSWSDIGFKKSGVSEGAVLGLSLGAVTFFAAYLTEWLILRQMGRHPVFSFYIANFTVAEQNITGASLSALGICLLGNATNVWAEEGLFRGLLFRIGRTVLTQRKANLLQAGLFGLWHVIVVAVWLADGSISVPAALVMSAGYVVLAGILGYEWGLCAALTGTLWAGLFEHFFNNFIGNFLHVVTETGVDELQILRIVLSNLLSLFLVVILTNRQNHRKTGRSG